MWVQLLRAYPSDTPVVVQQIERVALLQLLVAVLWDGRPLTLDGASGTGGPGCLCVAGRQVVYDGKTVSGLSDGGWPELPGPERMSILEMLAFVPADGDIAVRGRHASHANLWLTSGFPLGDQLSAWTISGAPTPGGEVLLPFDLSLLTTPQEVLNDALLPLLRSAEVWDGSAPSPV